MSYIYLLSPYSHPLKSIQSSRYQAAVDAVALIHKNKVPVYSPIVHWHVVGKTHGLPGDHEYWLLQDRAMMQSCSEGWVLAIPGWYESIGVQSEIKFIRERQGIVRTFNFEYLPTACDLWRATYAKTQADRTSQAQKVEAHSGEASGKQPLVSEEPGEGLPGPADQVLG